MQFLVTICITMRILSSLRSLTVNLQKKANDILAAYEHISDIMLELELLKTNCEEEFHSWFDEIKTFADDLSIPVCTPRIAVRQVHRAKVPADSPEVYYRRDAIFGPHNQ